MTEEQRRRGARLLERPLSAPGKLFVCGEYSVVWGGWARVLAVAPRLHAMARAREDRVVRLLTEGAELRGESTPRGVRWLGEVPAAFAFVARAVGCALRAHGDLEAGFEIAFASGARAPDGTKLGLGGSAAATLLAVEATRFLVQGRQDTLALALRAHRETQGGQGSGADVAAIHAGGFIRYRQHPSSLERQAEVSDSGAAGSPVGGESLTPDLLRLPRPDLLLAYVHLGRPASTTRLLEAVEQRHASASRARFVEASDAMGAALEGAIAKGDFAGVLRAFRELQALLADLHPGILVDEARRVIGLTELHGGAAKTSGAGGGDGCLVVAPDAATLERVLEALAARGFRGFHLEPAEGLKAEAVGQVRLLRWLDA